MAEELDVEAMLEAPYKKSTCEVFILYGLSAPSLKPGLQAEYGRLRCNISSTFAKFQSSDWSYPWWT